MCAAMQLKLAIGISLGQDQIQFNRDVRPILAENCFPCHGPDKNKREADLRLDTRDGLFGGSESTGVVIARDLNSELLQRIRSSDDSMRMPPPEFGKELNSDQVRVIERWIAEGAEWQVHWSLEPVRRSEPPPARSGFSSHPIDRFIDEGLVAAKLDAAPRADHRTILRRLYFDLHGLPPRLEMADPLPNLADSTTYNKLVDELLAAPAYGERMATWWLDLVRYADSVGYHGDQEVSVSPFRDYVIRAFHQNKRFDEFTIEQLAGDLLPAPTIEQRVAAGYNRLGMMSAEGGVQDKEYLAKYAAERVRNLGGAWLGLTLGCCECHDHKYDPFTSREFYQLEAFFADIEERGLYSGDQWGPAIPVLSTDQQAQVDRLNSEIAELEKRLQLFDESDHAAEERWEREALSWLPATPSSILAEQHTDLQLVENNAVLAVGEASDRDTYILEFSALPSPLRMVRLEVLPHGSLPNRGPGRAGNGNFVLTEIEIERYHEEDDQNVIPLPIRRAIATHEQSSHSGGNPYKKWSIEAAIDGDKKGEKWGWAILDQTGKAHHAIFELAAEQSFATRDRLRIKLHQRLDNPKHLIGHFRLAFATSEKVWDEPAPSPEILALLVQPRGERSSEVQKRVREYFRLIDPRFAELRTALQTRQQERDSVIRQAPTMLVTVAKEPRPIRVLPRGNWMDDSGDIVAPGIPSVLGTLSVDRRPNRLDLATWLVAKENPLTARVLANRLWKLFFGEGLSRNLGDFGAQGEWPSHPELLDWLACELVDSGWDIQHLIRLMVTSESYQRQSKPTNASKLIDPTNRWLSHQGRWRLDAEFVRDTCLRVSGLLVEQMGGRSVRPYQPKGYWAYLNFPMREWQNSQGRDLYRRGLYTHWQRQYLHPSLLVFDAPNREECTAARTRSNTPLQSLVLLNDPIFVECARVFAQRALESAVQADLERIEWMFYQALTREATEAEELILLRQLDVERRVYLDHPDMANSLLQLGEYPLPDHVDRPELAAWTGVARAILNLHETISRP